MTQDKKLKKEIRERTKRTGESYATARRHTLATRAKKAAKPIEAAARTATAKAGSSGAVSDAKCIEKTGHGLAHWFGVLDALDAAKLGHTAAARHLRNDHGVSPWYSQGITVAYERARGLRAVNQTSKGYEVSVSRVLPTSLEDSVKALSRASERARWLPESSAADALVGERLGGGKRRFKHSSGKARLAWKSDDAHTEMVLTATEDGRSRVLVTCRRMPKHCHVEVQRAQWRTVLDALRAYLRGPN